MRMRVWLIGLIAAVAACDEPSELDERREWLECVDQEVADRWDPEVPIEGPEVLAACRPLEVDSKPCYSMVLLIAPPGGHGSVFDVKRYLSIRLSCASIEW